MLVDEEDVIERWNEHIKGLYGDEEESGQDMLCREAVADDDREIMSEEVRRGRGGGVKKVKLRKSPSVCGVLPEMLKAREVVMKI